MNATFSISDTMSRLATIFFPQPTLADLVQRAYTRVASTCAMNDKALFSWDFLQDEGAGIVGVYIDGGLSRARAARALAQKWNVDTGNISSYEMRGRMGSTMLIADDFLTELTQELNGQYLH